MFYLQSSEPLENVLHLVYGALGRRLFKNERELLTTVASGKTVVPISPFDEKRGNLLETSVARNVSVPIVIRLEIVDIDERHDKCCPSCLSAFPRRLQMLVEGAPIWDPA